MSSFILFLRIRVAAISISETEIKNVTQYVNEGLCVRPPTSTLSTVIQVTGENLRANELVKKFSMKQLNIIMLLPTRLPIYLVFVMILRK
jgi:hypothetical protein